MASIKAIFKINSNITIWGDIEGDIADQTDLNNLIDSKVGEVAGNLTNEETARINADTRLQENIDTLSGTVSDNYNTLDGKIGDNTTAINNHIADKTNPHEVTKAQVGLGNVDNTSDLNKPISTATQNALDGKLDKNIAITGATKCKITYDSKGLVTEGADLQQSDIPALNLSKISDVTASANEVNILDGATLSTAELNVLDGITTSTTELNYVDGVTSSIQEQLNGKQPTITGGASTIVSNDLTTGRALVSNSNGKVDVSDITVTELGYLDGATSNIQSQIGNITDLIPANATILNQLADKEFVNSSISTNTANFIGTFIDVPTLEAYSGTVTNNDYAFVVNSVITDNSSDWATFNDLDAYDKSLLTNFDYAWVINGSNFDLYRFDILNQEWDLRVSDTPKASVTLNNAYNRYKATVSGTTVTWEWEFTLNNSSFTAAQWAAINSLITAETKVTHTANTAVGNSTTPVYVGSDGAVSPISYTIEKSVPSNAEFTDTTYTIATGSTNGTISVAVDGGTPNDVSVYGLGSAAYTNSSAYATSSQGTKADSAIQSVKVNGSALTPDANKAVDIAVPAAQVNSDWNASGGVAQILNKPAIPTVNNATLTIQKNSTTVQTFTANASSDVTCNITVPTDTGDLTNNAGFITSSALSGYQTTSNLVTSISSLSTDTEYPSAKCVYDIIGDIESLLSQV